MASVGWLLPVAVVAAGCGDAASDGAVLPGLDGVDGGVAITAPPLPSAEPPATQPGDDDGVDEALASVEAVEGDGQADGATSTTAAPTATTAAPTTLAAPSTTAAPEPDVFVRRGDTGPEVVSLQQRLIAVGYLDASGETGVFDDATADALIDFQAQYGLVVDGVFGPESDRALNAAAASIDS